MKKIINGSALAASFRQRIKAKVEEVSGKRRAPCLAVILVGDDPASQVYVASKEKACKEVGIASVAYRMPVTSSQEEVFEVIQRLNNDPAVDGILLQLPLPHGIRAEPLIAAIDPNKDVDGLTPINQGLLALGRPELVPCTPLGVIELLNSIGCEIRGKIAGVIGRSQLVGLPVARLLQMQDATVITMHSKTVDAKKLAKQCDILVVAAGVPHLVDDTWIKEGAIVIDVGIHRSPTGLIGDVNTAKAADLASYITPVPGGVGPMTIACLLQNCLKASLAKK